MLLLFTWVLPGTKYEPTLPSVTLDPREALRTSAQGGGTALLLHTRGVCMRMSCPPIPDEMVMKHLPVLKLAPWKVLQFG